MDEILSADSDEVSPVRAVIGNHDASVTAFMDLMMAALEAVIIQQQLRLVAGGLDRLRAFGL
jgi:hypothetical protein